MEVKGVLEGKKEGGRKGREKGLFVVYGGRKEIIDLRSHHHDEISQDYPGLSAKAIYSLNTSV